MTVQLTPSLNGYTPNRTDSGIRQDCSIDIGNRERIFHVFLPSAYDGTRKLPLLISLHGFGGYRPEREYWFYTAEREGFIAVYPEALKEEKWNIWGLQKKAGSPDDITFLDGVIDYMTARFAVDPARIYMHGQSMGDNMATYYAYMRPEKLAAIAVTSGPVLPSVMYTSDGQPRFSPKSALPVARTHGEKDYACGFPSTYGIPKQVIAEALSIPEQVELRYIMDSMQKNIWKKANGIASYPQLYFDLYQNTEIYKGENSDLIFYSLTNGAHHPSIDLFDRLWREALAGYHREGSRCVRDAGGISPDPEAIAFADGGTAWYIGLQAREMPDLHAEVKDEELYLSPQTITRLFPYVRLNPDCENPQQAVFHFHNHELQCAAGRGLFLLDGFVKAAQVPYYGLNGLMIPASDFLPLIGPYYVQCRYGAAYITTHPFSLTFDGASIIREMLGAAAPISEAGARKAEEVIRQKLQNYLDRKEETVCHS